MSSRLICVVSIMMFCIMPWHAQAATAQFTADTGAAVQASDVNVLDGTGYTLDENGTLTIQFTDLFATSATDSFTLYHYSTEPFGSSFSFSWGYMDDTGAIVYQSSAEYPYAQPGGSSFSVGFAFWGCTANTPGCNFIQINGDTAGFTLDALSLNGAIVNLVGAPPTPEPSTWMLLILSFAFVGYQLKRTERAGKNAPSIYEPAHYSAIQRPHLKNELGLNRIS